MAADSPPQRLLDTLRLRRVATARELGQALDASQPSISRWLAALGDQVVRIGRARSSRYAATRNVRGLGGRWPLYRIDSHGRPQDFARFTALYGDGCLIEPVTPVDWLRDDFRDGLFPGLPWFLDDLRPQGFLGRLFAQRHATELGLDPDMLRWSEDAVLAALLLRGDDAPGDFVLGDAALEQALRVHLDPLPADRRVERYDAIARATLTGERVGSSAAGEQPKFTACIVDADGSLRHVIVKFSDPVEGNPVARRWADLLVSEYLANQLLAGQGHATTRNELVWSRGRCCLESTRFDRIGAHGRRGFVSLAAWSDAHDGVRDSWPQAADRMCEQGWLDPSSVEQIRRRWWFGRMIGNTDMHFGNLGFLLDDHLPLALAPGYDMLPMLYRPAANGGIAARDFQPPVPLPAALPHWRQAATWADTFWQQVSMHPDISPDFQRIARDNRIRLDALRQRFG